MNFTVTKNFPSVQSYLKDFLKISKKNIHEIYMNSHHNKNTILINGEPSNIRQQLNKNDIITIDIETLKSNYLINEERSIDIEYEDDYLLIASKPEGIKTHPNDIKIENDTLVNYLIKNYDYLEPIHRLDIDTQGLVIFAKTPLIKAKLDYMLEQKEIHRFYTALVKNKIEPQKIETYIGRDSKEKNKQAIVTKGKIAITNVLNCEKIANGVYKTTLSLETGRTHQIRVHLSHIKSSIIGDRLYSKDGNKYKKMYLAALTIQFIHPVLEKNINITSRFKDNFTNN